MDPTKFKLSEVVEGSNMKTGPNVSPVGPLYFSVCVKECPMKGQNVTYLKNSFYDKDVNSKTEFKDVNVKKMIEAMEKTPHEELTPWEDYDTQDLMGFCVFTQEEMKAKGDKIYEEMSKKMGNMTRYLDDVSVSWKIILVVSILSLFITLIYLYLLKWITKPIMYISLFLVFIFGALITFWCYKRSQQYPDGSDDQKYAYVATAISGILTVCYTIFICCQWKNIKIGAEIMGVAGEFVSTQPRIMITPFVAYFAMIPIVIWFIFTSVFLYSCGSISIEKYDMFATL